MRYLYIFLVSGLLTLIITPTVRKLALRVKAIDVPKDKRRVHEKPIPRMGGLGIYITFLIFALGIYYNNRQVYGILIGSTIIVAMGIVDDIYQIRPLYKIIFQILAVSVLLFFGISIKNITVPFSNFNSISTGYFGIIFTYIWVIGVTNAINLIDGLDGLACGVSCISSLTLFVVALISGRYTTATLTIILAGSCIGFLRYNFNPASIFMGDTGSQFLGFVLAAISTQAAVKSVATVSIIIPIMALGLPIFDTLFAMLRRKINKRPIMEADRGHLHHKLLDKGLSHRRAVVTMYIVSAVMGFFAVIAALLPPKQSYLIFFIVCLAGGYVAYKIGIFRTFNND